MNKQQAKKAIIYLVVAGLIFVSGIVTMFGVMYYGDNFAIADDSNILLTTYEINGQHMVEFYHNDEKGMRCLIDNNTRYEQEKLTLAQCWNIEDIPWSIGE